MADNRPATDLLDDPMLTEGDLNEINEVEGVTPFDKAFGALTTVYGPRLELLTRTTPKLAIAIDHTFNRGYNFGSKYLLMRIATLERLAVSMDGKGRAEVVDALKAGAGVPGEFYDNGATRQSMFADDLPESDDDEEDKAI